MRHLTHIMRKKAYVEGPTDEDDSHNDERRNKVKLTEGFHRTRGSIVSCSDTLDIRQQQQPTSTAGRTVENMIIRNKSKWLICLNSCAFLP